MHMHFVTCGNITETPSDLLLHVIMCVVIQSENSLINKAEFIIRCGSN